MNFWRFWAARHISRANCAKITRDRLGQPAYEIFSIKCQFEQSKQDGAQKHQKEVPL